MDSTKRGSLRLIESLWRGLHLPESALNRIQLKETVVPFSASHLPTSFRVDDLAQATIGVFHLATAHYYALSTGTPLKRVTVSPLVAALEFKSETHFTIDDQPLPFPKSFGGLYATKDGHVRIHDGFEVHRECVRQILGLPSNADRSDVAAACRGRGAQELEEAAFNGCAVIGALRSFDEWDSTTVGQAIPDFPIRIYPPAPTGHKDSQPPPAMPLERPQMGSRALAGLRVVELSRVIAAPVAGRALAAHGAEVLWVTSPNLEDQPFLDRDFARGKRTIRLDLTQRADLETIKNLIKDADVFLQGYRPGSLAWKGLGPDDLHAINPRLIYASMSAYPQNTSNSWRHNRGFDSIVQTCSGINVAEAHRHSTWANTGETEPARPLPCQALDHGSGFLLASGIVAALCRRQETGQSQVVEVSLAGTSRLLRSLGQLDPPDAFEGKMNTRRISEVLEKYGPSAEHYFATSTSEMGRMKYVKPAGTIDGLEVGWTIMPRALGSDISRWTD